MKSKSLILSIIIIFVPFLFAVNILRVHSTGNSDNYLSFESIMEYTSEIDFSFSDTYIQIARVATSWQEATGIIDYLNAIFDAMTIPFTMSLEFFEGIWDCIQVFGKFVGVSFGSSGGSGGGDGGGGGGSGT